MPQSLNHDRVGPDVRLIYNEGIKIALLTVVTHRARFDGHTLRPSHLSLDMPPKGLERPSVRRVVRRLGPRASGYDSA